MKLVYNVIVFSISIIFAVSCNGSSQVVSDPLPTFVPPGIRLNPSVDKDTKVALKVEKNLGVIANYNFDVSLDYAGHRIQVTQLIEVFNPGPDVWSELVFYLPKDLQSDRFVLSTVGIQDGIESSATQMQVTKDGFLVFQLSKYIEPNQSRIVTITYGLEALQVDLQSLSPIGDVGYSENVLQFVHWYPILVPYKPGVGWIRWSNINSIWSILTEISDYNLLVRSPEGVLVASGGPSERRGNEWYFVMQNVRHIAFSASPNYELKTRTTAGVTIYLFHLIGDGFAGDAVLNAASRSLVMFNDRYGYYPYTSLVVAQNHYRSSMASGGILLHSGSGFDTYSGQTDSLLTVLVPLTLSEIWWGQLVGYDRIVEPWIGASLAMYSEYMYYEEYFPELTEWFWTDRIDYWNPQGSLNSTVYEINNKQSLMQNTYRIGARFLHEVNNNIGSSAFRSFTRDLYRNNAFRMLDTQTFFDMLAKYLGSDTNSIKMRYFDENIVIPTLSPPLTPIFDLSQSPTATPVQRIHEVISGDTLVSISIQYEVPMQMIIDRNRISDASQIVVGSRLIIPYP